MQIWAKHSSASVFKSTRIGQFDNPAITLHSARNMAVSAQLLLREVTAFDIMGVTYADLPENVTASFAYQGYVVFNDGVPYPDMIVHQNSLRVEANTTQGVWLDFEVSQDAKPGIYKIPYKVSTSAGDFNLSVTLTIYDVTIPEPKKSEFGHEYFFCAGGHFDFGKAKAKRPTQPFYEYERYSEKWWALMANYAKAMKKMRVNSLCVYSPELLLDAGSSRIGEEEWKFDFSLFDRLVETMLENGSYKYVTLGAMVASVTGKQIVGIDYNNKFCLYDIYTPEAERWAKAYYAAMYKHFAEKGWLGMLQTHIQDEPHSSEYYQWARNIVRECMPDITCSEPIDTHAIGRELAGYCDTFIPRLEVYDEGDDFYTERQKKGDCVWCYSCCFPEESWWMNKFIDCPHGQSRTIKWACYSQGITGFLHWGFNYWNDDLIHGKNPDARFKGDGYVVYPDVANNDVSISVRGRETRDGIQDWELLNMLGKTNPETAAAISRRVARNFRDTEVDADLIEQCKTEILELLSQS